MAQVVLERVRKTYANGIEAVANVDLRIEDGEFFAFVGPSGSGKTTLLRMIAGLETLDEGAITIAGRDVSRLSPRERDVAMVFQNPPLHPHLSVFENIAFPLRARKQRGNAVRVAVEEIAARLGISMLLKRRPQTLSAGQKQRVALGRAFVRKPNVFLFDEPLSSLDESLRAEVRALLMETHQRTGATMLYVTHDQGEALGMGDRVGVMDRGRLLQTGSPRDLYDRPATRFVASFIGDPAMRMIPLTFEIRQGRASLQLLGTPEVTSTFPLDSRSAAIVDRFSGRTVELGLRSEHVRIASTNSPRDPQFAWLGIEARLVRSEYRGHELLATLRLGSHELHARLPSDISVPPNGSYEIGLDFSRASWFATDSGMALLNGIH